MTFGGHRNQFCWTTAGKYHREAELWLQYDTVPMRTVCEGLRGEGSDRCLLDVGMGRKKSQNLP